MERERVMLPAIIESTTIPLSILDKRKRAAVYEQEIIYFEERVKSGKGVFGQTLEPDQINLYKRLITHLERGVTANVNYITNYLANEHRRT